MRKSKLKKNRFDSESVDPMQYLANLSDAMLVLAVGILLALIVHWNVDISASGDVTSDPGVSYAADGTQIDRENALHFSEDELAQMQTEQLAGGQGMEKLGEVYYDAETGQYYIVQAAEEKSP